MARNKELESLYNSKEWKKIRLYKLASVDYRCERCGGIAVEVHHKIKITPENRYNSDVTLNQDNLEAICIECHNEEHGRFKKNHIRFDKEGNLAPY